MDDTKDFSHLYAIEDRLHREKMRLAAAKTPQDRAFREVQVMQAERERKHELEFLGVADEYAKIEAMNDDELARELGI